MPTMIQIVRVPAAMLALASILLLPVYSASAQGFETPPCPQAAEVRNHRPIVAFEIESITKNGNGSGTVLGTLEHVPQCLSDATGIYEGDIVTVQYTTNTKFMAERVPTTIDAFEVGELAFALGNIDFESVTVVAFRMVDRPANPKYHFREVVEVDTDANFIVLKNLGPADELAEDEYVYVTYDEETTFMKDHEVTDESAVSVGDKVHVQGIPNWDSGQYLAEMDADTVVLFNELPAGRPHQLGNNPSAPQT